MFSSKSSFPVDIKDQSQDVPGEKGAKQSKLMPPGVALEYVFNDAKTVVEAMWRGQKVSDNGPCLGWRDSDPEYKWLKYGEVIERAKNISYGLMHIGMKRGQDTFFGIYCQNCVEWVLIEYACYMQSAILVPLYDTLGPTACNFILNNVDAEFLMCDTEKKVRSILEVKDDVPKLRHIIVVQDVGEGVKKLAEQKEVTLHQLKDIEIYAKRNTKYWVITPPTKRERSFIEANSRMELGRKNPESLLLPKPSDLATVCFTSGTTGNPKGVMLTHGNMVADASGFIKHLLVCGLVYGEYSGHFRMKDLFVAVEDYFMEFLSTDHKEIKTAYSGKACVQNFGEAGQVVFLTERSKCLQFNLYHQGTDYIGVGDRLISYLPMAHMLDRLSQVILYMVGGSVGFFRGDIKLLAEDISALQPTMLPAVPRILNKVYDKVQNEVKRSLFKKFLLDLALRAKKAEIESGIIRNDSPWDRFILKKVRNALGGKVRLIVSAGAPIRDEVLSFFRFSLGCIVVQGYGQTEGTAASNCEVIGDTIPGSVGPPLPCCFVKLGDVPDMGYFAEKGEGEILIKGPTVTKGYFKDPEKTAEIIDADGWLHTGDIGQWLKNGSLAVIDRKKNLLKLSQGEYVSSEKVEAVYLGCPLVEQIYVHGNSFENCLVAIVVPEKETLMSWCSEEGIKGDWKELCENEQVKEHISKELNQLGKTAGLRGFEQVKAIHLSSEGFSLQNETLTVTMKLKRVECRRLFKDVIDKMYDSLR